MDDGLVLGIIAVLVLLGVVAACFLWMDRGGGRDRRVARRSDNASHARSSGQPQPYDPLDPLDPLNPLNAPVMDSPPEFSPGYVEHRSAHAVHATCDPPSLHGHHHGVHDICEPASLSPEPFHTGHDFSSGIEHQSTENDHGSNSDYGASTDFGTSDYGGDSGGHHHES